MFTAIFYQFLTVFNDTLKQGAMYNDTSKTNILWEVLMFISN